MARKEHDANKPPEEVDPLRIIQGIGEAAAMLKGARPVKGDRPKGAGSISERSGKPRMKKEALKPQPGEQKLAEIKAAEGTPEWHSEVVEALRAGKSISGLKPEQIKIESAHKALGTAPAKKSVHYLVAEGMPKSDTVAVVVADIAESKFRDDPVYLVAKEAQLVYSMRSDMVISEQVEIGKAVSRLHERIALLRSQQPDSQDLEGISGGLRGRMFHTVEDKITSDKKQKDEKKEEGMGEEENVDVTEDIKKSLNEISAAAGDPILEAKVALLTIPDDAVKFLSDHIGKGESLQESLKAYAVHLKQTGRITLPQARFIVEVSDIVKDPSVAMAALGHDLGAAGGEVWDGKKKSGNKALDAYLQRVQHIMDTTGLKGDPRGLQLVLDNFIDAKNGYTAAELKKVGDPQQKIERMLAKARREYETKPPAHVRGEGLHEQFSDMFLSANRKKITVLFPEWSFDDMYRRFNMVVTFDVRGKIPEQFARDIQQVASYYANDRFLGDIEELMSVPEYRAEINRVTGQDIAELPDGSTDLSRISEHPFYKDRVKRLRELSKRIQSTDMLDYVYGTMKMGQDIVKVQAPIVGSLGDTGIYDGKKKAGYVTGSADHIVDDLSDLAKNNTEHGYRQRYDDPAAQEVQLTAQDIFSLNPQFGDIYSKHYKSLSSIGGKKGEGDFSRLCKMIGIDNQPMTFDAEHIEGVVKEGQKLNTVTLREVRARMNSLSPGESDGQNGQAPKYASEEGLTPYLQARKMYEFFMERWDLLDPASQQQLRLMAHQYAELVGADKVVRRMVDRAMSDPVYKERIAAEALDVYEQDSRLRTGRIETRLSSHFTHDLDGYIVAHPPTSDLRALTPEQLTEILMFKQGMRYADMVVGGYGYEGASWVAEAKTIMYDLIYGKNSWTRGIGVGEYKRHLGSTFVGAESAEAHNKIAHILIHGERDGVPGVLQMQGEYQTTRSFQDLIEHQHWETLQKFKDMWDKKFFEGTFTDIRLLAAARRINPHATAPHVEIGADRPDLAIRYMKMTDRVVDELLSFKGSDPINWAYPDRMSPTQDQTLTDVCKNMGVDKEKFIKLKKTLADFVLEDDQLLRLTDVDMIDTYFDVSDLDSREKFLDDPEAAPGSKYKENRTHIDPRVIDRVSAIIGGNAGKSEKCGIARLFGDNGRAQASASLVVDLVGIRSEEALLKAAPELRKNILFTFGRQFASRGIAVVGGSWIKMVSMDTAGDWLLYGSLFNQQENSIIRRVTHLKGDHGDLAMTLNERHGLWTTLQKEIKDAFETDLATGTNLYMEKQMGLVWDLPGGGHTHAPWYLYTYGFAGLLAGIGAGAKVGEEATEGFAEGSGSGGGGKGS